MQINDWSERQYNPRLTLPNINDLLTDWRTRAYAFRSRVQPSGDIKYGPHPRENYDVFKAENAKGALIYIHGGYWRSFSKLETSFVTEAYLAAGYTVALINYPLCPDVDLAHIRSAVLRAFRHLWNETLSSGERSNVLVTGHSAGGHLAALHAVADWKAYGLPADPIKGIVSLSGVFDVTPLIGTSINNDLCVNEETAAAMNLMSAVPSRPVPVLLAVGGDESEEFHRQSTELAERWDADALSVPGLNHFTIVNAFADPSHDLHRKVRAFLEMSTR